MKIFYSFHKFLKSPSGSKRFAVGIGVFDGVHKGHKSNIGAIIKKAKAKKLLSLVITFHPHPGNVLKRTKKIPLLISLKHRLQLFKEMGIDCAIVIPFTKKLSRMESTDFLHRFFGKLSVKEIVLGKNFFFGRDQKGSQGVLEKFSKQYGYNVNVITPVRYSGKSISSTRIRRLILNGKLGKAARLLSRPVTVLGTVVKGESRGRIIGFRTANVNPHHEAIPPSGVYAVKVRLHKRIHKGILNIGTKPTFTKGRYPVPEATIEVHIFDFAKSIYKRDLEISFVKRIRREKPFKTSSALKRQIERDVKLANQILR